MTDNCIGFVVREKRIKESGGGGDAKPTVTYADVSRIYHSESAAQEFCRLARRHHGMSESDASRFWVTRKRKFT